MMLTREKAQGERAAIKRLLSALGFDSPKALTEFVTSQREAEQAALWIFPTVEMREVKWRTRDSGRYVNVAKYRAFNASVPFATREAWQTSREGALPALGQKLVVSEQEQILLEWVCVRPVAAPDKVPVTGGELYPDEPYLWLGEADRIAVLWSPPDYHALKVPWSAAQTQEHSRSDVSWIASSRRSWRWPHVAIVVPPFQTQPDLMAASPAPHQCHGAGSVGGDQHTAGRQRRVSRWCRTHALRSAGHGVCCSRRPRPVGGAGAALTVSGNGPRWGCFGSSRFPPGTSKTCGPWCSGQWP